MAIWILVMVRRCFAWTHCIPGAMLVVAQQCSFAPPNASSHHASQCSFAKHFGRRNTRVTSCYEIASVWCCSRPLLDVYAYERSVPHIVFWMSIQHTNTFKVDYDLSEYKVCFRWSIICCSRTAKTKFWSSTHFGFTTHKNVFLCRICRWRRNLLRSNVSFNMANECVVVMHICAIAHNIVDGFCTVMQNYTNERWIRNQIQNSSLVVLVYVRCVTQENFDRVCSNYIPESWTLNVVLVCQASVHVHQFSMGETSEKIFLYFHKRSSLRHAC